MKTWGIIVVMILLTTGCLNSKQAMSEINGDYQLIEHKEAGGKAESATFTSRSKSKADAEKYFSDWCKAHGYRNLSQRLESNLISISYNDGRNMCSINIFDEEVGIRVKVSTIRP